MDQYLYKSNLETMIRQLEQKCADGKISPDAYKEMRQAIMTHTDKVLFCADAFTKSAESYITYEKSIAAAKQIQMNPPKGILQAVSSEKENMVNSDRNMINAIMEINKIADALFLNKLITVQKPLAFRSCADAYKQTTYMAYLITTDKTRNSVIKAELENSTRNVMREYTYADSKKIFDAECLKKYDRGESRKAPIKIGDMTKELDIEMQEKGNRKGIDAR